MKVGCCVMAVPHTSDILREVIFAPFEYGGRTRAVYERLRNAVALDVFKDGEQLPPETDLAAQLGVSPVTLREALGLMRDAGLVETKRGRFGGTFIRRSAYEPRHHGQSLLSELSQLDLRDLSDWRISVAETSAALAADRASDDEVAGLRTHATAFVEATDAPVARLAEGRFYIGLATASQSLRHTRAAVASIIEYGPLLSLAFDSETLRAAVGRCHIALVDAVGEGNRYEAARSAMDAGNLIADALAGHLADLNVGSKR